jgi:hypothetical protein
VAEQEVDRTAEVARRLVDGQLGHQPARLVGVVGRGAAVEVGGERDEALAGQPVGDAGDVLGQAPPLLDDDHARARAGLRDREVAVRRTAPAREGGVLQGVLVGHGEPLVRGQR